MASEFKYFDVLIFYVLIIYIFILLIYLCIRRSNIKKSIIERGINLEEESYYDTSMFSFELTTRFEEVTQSSWKGLKLLLLFYRLSLAIFFLNFSIILSNVQRQRSVYYFTNWNSLIVTTYFILAFISSIIAVYYQYNRNQYELHLDSTIIWSQKIKILGAGVHMCFEIAGASSIFAIIFDNLFIDSDDFNILMQAVGILAIVALTMELILSTVRVRYDQYPATIAFIMIYLIMMWPSVFTGIIPDWPYTVFRTDRSQCFGYYTLLFLLHFISFYCWYFIYRIKKRIMIYYNLGRTTARFADFFFDTGEEDYEGGNEYDADGVVMATVYPPNSSIDRDTQLEFADATVPTAATGVSSAVRPGVHPRGHYAPRSDAGYSTDPIYTDPNYFNNNETNDNTNQREPSFLRKDPYDSMYTDNNSVHSEVTGTSRSSAAAMALARVRAKAAAGLPITARSELLKDGDFDLEGGDDESINSSRYSLYSTGSYSYYSGVTNDHNASLPSEFDNTATTNIPSFPNQNTETTDKRSLMQRKNDKQQQSYYGSGYYEFNPDDPLGRGASRKLNTADVEARPPIAASTHSSRTSGGIVAAAMARKRQQSSGTTTALQQMKPVQQAPTSKASPTETATIDNREEVESPTVGSESGASAGYPSSSGSFRLNDV